MLIEKQENGWSLSTAEHTGLWHLIFRDKIIINFFESSTSTSTSMDLFIGTFDEANQYITDNNLVYDTKNSLETIVNVIEPVFVMPEYIAEYDEVIVDNIPEYNADGEVINDEII